MCCVSCVYLCLAGHHGPRCARRVVGGGQGHRLVHLHIEAATHGGLGVTAAVEHVVHGDAGGGGCCITH